MNCDRSDHRLSSIEGANALFIIAWRSLVRINIDVWLVALAGILAWGSFFFGERVAMRDGLGWDGEIYWSWVKDFPHEIREAGIDSYRIQRIMSSALLHYSFRLLRVAPTIKNTLCGFAALNVMSIMLVAYFWCLIANHLKISLRGKWLGIIGLLLNCSVLKLSGYFPAMIDMQAYACGAAMSYCYVTRRRVGLWMTTMIGAFLWPTQLYVGTILSLFPRELDNHTEAEASFLNRPLTDSSGASLSNAPFRLDIIIAAFAAFYSCVWSLYVCRQITIPLFGGLYPIKSLLGLSLAISTLFIFLGLRPLLNCRELYGWPKALWPREILWTIGTLLIAASVKYAQACISNRPGYFSFNVYCLVIGIMAVAKPGLFYLSHLVYFGPFWLLAARFWPTICREIHRQQGIGLTLVVAIGVCHCLDAESRHLVYLVPIVIPYVVKVVERLDWSKNQVMFLTVVSVLCSKCWLYIGGPFVDNANLFPDQYFWMNVGSFMSDQSYVWQLSCGVVCAVLMSQMLQRKSSSSSSRLDSTDQNLSFKSFEKQETMIVANEAIQTPPSAA